MAQSDNHSDPKTRHGQHHRQELATHQSTVPSGLIVVRTPAAKNTDTNPFPTCTTWPSTKTLDIHCTVDDHRRHSFRLLKKTPSHRAVLVVLGLTTSFDNVHHKQLLDCVYNTSIPATIRRSLNKCMQNRRAKVHFLNQESMIRKVKTVVVHSGVLSPALSNYYLADFSTPPPNNKRIKYAHDITICTSGPVVTDVATGLNISLSQVINCICNKKLTVSAAKCTVAIFTPDTHEHHPHSQLKLAGQVLPLEKKPNE